MKYLIIYIAGFIATYVFFVWHIAKKYGVITVRDLVLDFIASLIFPFSLGWFIGNTFDDWSDYVVWRRSQDRSYI